MTQRIVAKLTITYFTWRPRYDYVILTIHENINIVSYLTSVWVGSLGSSHFDI